VSRSQRLFPLRVDDVTSMNIFEGSLSDQEEHIDTLRPRWGWSASSASSSTWHSSASNPTTDESHRADPGLDLGKAYLNNPAMLKSSERLRQVPVPTPREADRPDEPADLPPTDLPPTDLQRTLTELSAPSPLTGWARPFADLESCWKACPSPEHLLWLAARLSKTKEERRAVVSCLTELARRAGRGNRKSDESVERAVSLADAWARAGGSLDDLLAAERAALDTAARASAVAAEQHARARMLFRSAPRGRPASSGTSRALGAMTEWREAEQTRRLALAAAGAARAAAEAAQAAQADESDSSPEGWVACVGESTRYVISALAGSHPGGRDDRMARKSARLIRRRLRCPRLD